MPFKGVHGHTRHTHEDKVKEKKKQREEPMPKRKAKDDQTAVMNEVDLYNTPFEPFAPNKPAHYVNRFFRRAAQTVVHCVLALSPHFYMHTDELFDWMMPYERMGALLAEDAEDYILREKARARKKQEELNKAKGLPADHGLEKEQEVHQRDELAEQQGQRELSASPVSSSSIESSSSTQQDGISANPQDQRTDGISPPPDNKVSSIFSCAAHNPRTNHEVQVNPEKPSEVVHPAVSHYHPPFLVIDSRRTDEYNESHIHGAVNIHYIPPKVLGEKFDFTLPSWVEKDTPIITYCAVGLRSGLMVWELRRRGYRFVKVLSGGYYKWVNEGRPIYASGELTQKVLEQHKLAGIMLRKELKAQKKMLQRKEEQDKRVASHHAKDGDWPPCPRYSICEAYDKAGKKEKESKKDKEVNKQEMRRKSNIVLHLDKEGGKSSM